MTTSEIKEEPAPQPMQTEDGNLSTSSGTMVTTNATNMGTPLQSTPAAKSSSAKKSNASSKTAEREQHHDYRDAITFYKDLQTFHDSRNTPITRYPKIDGTEVDLHKLYLEVTARGGWLKVNNRNEWEDLLSPVLGLKKRCVNASVALKQIYTRFLDKFERAYFLGEDPDKTDEQEEETGRHKKWSSKTMHLVPMTYNYAQHKITDQMRITHKLSTDLYKSSEYDKLLLSLLSPLPNEQDFAINVCTLMANESKDTLKVNHCPKLLDALVAHAGVYYHRAMRELFNELYTKIRKHSLQSFWDDCLQDKQEILELSFEDCVQTGKEGSVKLNSINIKQLLHSRRKDIFQDGLNASATECEQDDLNRLDFLSLGRGLGTHDYVGQRVNQVTSIMRNLSFFEENITTLAKNRTFIRFLVMCANIRWGNVHHMALDICGNIATEIELLDASSDDLTKCLLLTIREGLEGPDRGVIISCLEILYKLCQKNANEEALHKCLDQKMFNQICLFLSLNDIMLLLYTLECIYALSSLGHRSCNYLIQVKGIVDTLVSLITVEAQSYGPDGCILMRVVETVPGNMLPMVAQNIANLQNAAMTVQQMHQPVMHLLSDGSAGQHVSGQMHPAPLPSNVKVVHQAIQPPQMHSPQLKEPPPPQCMPVTPTISKQAQQQHQQIQENEQYALAWLSATFEMILCEKTKIEQQELYKMYLSFTQKNGRRGLVSAIHFPRLVRKIFGNTIGPNLIKSTDANGSTINSFFYVGLRPRQNPLPMQIKTVNMVVQNSGQVTPVKTVLKTLQNQPDSQQKLKVVAKKGQSITVQMQQEQGQFVPQQQTSSQAIQVQSSVSQLQKQIVQTPGTVIQQPTSSSSIIPSSPESQIALNKLQGKNIIISKTIIQPVHQQSQQIAGNSAGIISQAINQVNAQIQANQQQQQQIQIQLASQQQQQQQQQFQQMKCSSGAGGQPSTSGTNLVSNGNGAASSLIKSLLANKVTTTTTANCDVTDTIATAAPNNTSCLITQNVNLHQVAQRQHLQKQKELAQQQQQQQQQQHHQQQSHVIIKPSSALQTTTISALVNNPIIQSTAVKVGQTTIKAISTNSSIPASIIEKKNVQIATVSTDSSDALNWDPIPPLVPLSAHNKLPIMTGNGNGISIQEDSNSVTNSIAIGSIQINSTDESESNEAAVINFEGLIIPKSKSVGSSANTDGEDGTSSSNCSKDSLQHTSTRQQSIITSNQMLVDLLDKKSPEPSVLNITFKRKLEDNQNESDTKRKALDVNINAAGEIVGDQKHQEARMTASKTAANLYAEIAASILEDEDLEEAAAPLQQASQQQIVHMQLQQTPVQQLIQQQSQTHQIQTPVIQKTADAQKQLITMPIQRQIIMTPSSTHQMILSQSQPHMSQSSQTTATATIKTDAGLQTVPVIIQKQMGPNGQQVLQPVIQQAQPQQTQYVLATNPQGQTYLVAQQPQPQTQTLLVTQTPQQQGTQTKTIIILQQPGGPPQAAVAQQQIISSSGTPQKMIMTTPQGQQMIVTQVPRPVQHQIIMNHPGGTTGVLQQANPSPNVVITQSAPVIHQQPQIHIQTQSAQTHISKQVQIQTTTAQIQTNPSSQQQAILSQLSHIPATIKIHSQQTQTTQTQSMPKTFPVKHTVSTQIVTPGQISAGKQQTTQQQQTQTPVKTQEQKLDTQPSFSSPMVVSPSPILHTKSSVIQAPTAVIQSSTNNPQQQLPQMQRQQQQIQVQRPQQPTQTQQQQTQQQQTQKSIQSLAQQISQQQQHISQIQQQSQQQSITQTGSQNSPLPALSSNSPQMSGNTGASTPPHTPPVPSNNKQDTKSEEEVVDLNWLWICDWRNCPRKKFKSLNEVYAHACKVHCPDNLDLSAEIYCQWGPGPNLCDNIPRKRFSLMTHLLDRHCTVESLKAAVQRRLTTGLQPITNCQPVTIIKNPPPQTSNGNQDNRGTASPALSTSSSGSLPSAASAAMHAIKRHTSDFLNPKEWMDENEGPVTKSIRLTAALVLRNLVVHTTAAKRNIRHYEPHLAGVALSNVESSTVISQILYELSN